MDAHPILPAATEETEQEHDPVPSQKGKVLVNISDQEPAPSTSQEQGDSMSQEHPKSRIRRRLIELASIYSQPMVRASAVPPRNRVIYQLKKRNRVILLCKDHLIMNVIFGIVFASLALLRWYEGRNYAAILDSATTLIGLVGFINIVNILVWALPQSMISRNYAGLENYMRTAGVVLNAYAALLMVNIQYIIIVIIPCMIFLFIGALAWKSRETGASQYNNNEEVLSDNNQSELFSSKSSDKLARFDRISYFLQLSLVTWTQYKGQQGCTPILSDFLLFLGSALGALGVMLASPLAGVDSRAVSIQVLPVLHKTCTVLLLVAVHTLAAEWLGEDMIFVCLPELIVLLVWFTICFGQPMSDSSSMSPKSQVIISSAVAILVYLTSWQANGWNMHVSWIIWVFWISLSSSALSGFHAWLLLGWPGSTSESNKLIHLLIVASAVGSSAAVILCVSLVLTDPSILHESISSFQHKTIATVLSVFCTYLLHIYAAHRRGHPETQAPRAPDKKYSDVGEVCTHMLVKLYAKLVERLKEDNSMTYFGLVRLRNKRAKTLDKIFQVAFKLASMVGIPGSEVQYMKSVIKDRYYQLDVELRICLLHLSIFPVGQVIEVERLVRLWMAEGFIDEHLTRTRTNRGKVRIANDYIYKLVVRKFIMYGDGMNRTISIDPDIHNFIVCMSTEQMLVTLVHSEQEDVSPSKGTVRRLSLLNNGKEDQAAAGTYGKHLRSVTVFNNTGGMPLLAETTLLRVLDLEGCKGTVCLDDLHKLLFLKYLGLRGTDVSELPAQIEKLTCLETLDVRSTKVKEIPSSILSLQKLMHLLAGNAKLPCGIGKMKMLFALSCPDVATNSMSIMQELGEIDNLTELELICEPSQVSGEKKQVTFPSHGFRSLHKLSVQFGYSSLTFETGALPNVQVLGLKLDKGLPEGSTSVSGIEHLQSLNHVHVKYSRDDANAKAVVAAVKEAAKHWVRFTKEE